MSRQEQSFLAPQTKFEIEWPDRNFKGLKGKSKITDLAQVRLERLIPPKEETGAYLEALDEEKYVALLEAIANYEPENEIEDDVEGLSLEEQKLLFQVIKERMNRTDATDGEYGQKQMQIDHLEAVHGMVTVGANLLRARNPKIKINQRISDMEAILHDSSKFTPAYTVNDQGVVEEIPGNVAGKAKTNPDLFGHNAHSAVDALAIAKRFGLSKDEGIMLAKAILIHSSGEFPDELAQVSVAPEDHSGKLGIYKMKNPPPQAPTLFVRGEVEGVDAKLLHSADLLVGAGTESYIKYLEQHVRNKFIVGADQKTAQARNWPQWQTALKSCFDTSAKNYLEAESEVLCQTFGWQKIAEAQAMREYFDEEQADPEVLGCIKDIEGVDYNDPALAAQAVKAYEKLLALAGKYSSERQQEPNFITKYAKKFLERQIIEIEDDAKYWKELTVANEADGRKKDYYLVKNKIWRQKVDHELERLAGAM